MAQSPYLSTDPNAGQPMRGAGDYLSTDPNAGTGDPEMAAAPERQPPTTAGFLGNVVTSGVNFAKNIASPIAHPIETIRNLVQLAKEPSQTGALLKDALVKRYGSIDAILNTAYNDPVGMASDLSIVTGGAATAAKGLGAARSAQVLGQMSQALNPLA